jgi:hypothetical protein
MDINKCATGLLVQVSDTSKADGSNETCSIKNGEPSTTLEDFAARTGVLNAIYTLKKYSAHTPVPSQRQ